MKTNLFIKAIRNRCRLKFLYDLNELIVEPYYLTQNKSGNKIMYGRIEGSQEIRMFEYKKIVNVKIDDNYHFSPIIPILPHAS